jgi:hypothetical protein
MTRLDWKVITQHAADIVRGYSTGVTLRQLFYRLVSDGTLPNTDVSYKTLSARTAAARRELRQVELDALDPNDLRSLYQSALDEFWDTSAYQAALEREEAERAQLERS